MSVETIEPTSSVVEPEWRWYPDGTGGGALGHALLDVELRLERDDAGGVYAAWFTWASGELVALVDVAQA